MFADYASISETEAIDELLWHLGADDLNGLNSDQRIILASHRFAPEVTSASIWLNEKTPDEDLITCIQLIPYHDAQTDSLFIQANTIIPMPGAEEYSIGIGDAIGEENGDRPSDLALKLRRTKQRRNDDEVTRFLRNAARLTIEKLPEETRPDVRSRWGVGQPNHRYYFLWYSRHPWLNRRIHYQISLYPVRDEKFPLWKAEVGFGYYRRRLKELNFSQIQLESLESSIIDLGIHSDDLAAFSGGERWRSLMLGLDGSHSLDDAFAKLISNTLRPIIEAITPAIDEFEDERNQ